MTLIEIFADLGNHFLAALLVAPDNHPLATYTRKGLDQSTVNAPIQTTQRIFNNPDSREALEQLQESVFYDLDGRRLVCRPIRVNKEIHLLIVLIPAERAYRRQVNQLVRKIESALTSS